MQSFGSTTLTARVLSSAAIAIVGHSVGARGYRDAYMSKATFTVSDTVSKCEAASAWGSYEPTLEYAPCF